MQHFVISLKNATTRREHIRAAFDNAGVNFSFFDAVTPQNTVAVAKALGFSLYEPSPISPVEMACLLSHVALWKQIAEGADEVAGIYEDDIHLSPAFAAVVAQAEQSALSGHHAFDVLKLETMFHHTITTRPKAWFGEFQTARLKRAHYGTGAYLITRSCAKALWRQAIARSQRRHTVPSDNLIFRELLHRVNSQQLIPAIAYQDSVTPSVTLASQMETERQAYIKQTKTKRTVKSWLKFNYAKLFRYPIHFIYNYYAGGRIDHEFIAMHQRPDLPPKTKIKGLHYHA